MIKANRNDDAFMGGIPDYLVCMIGVVLMLDAMHLHALHEAGYCFAGSLVFSAGVVSLLALACRSLSSVCCLCLNIAGVFLLAAYLILFFGNISLLGLSVHGLLIGVALWSWFWRDGA